MKVSTSGAAAVAILLWGASAAFWFGSLPSPVQMLGGDLVVPAKVKPGGTVAVTRNMRFTRIEDVRVTRTMIRGDCKVSCEFVDLPGSNLALVPGDYMNFIREHKIPESVDAGTWRLVFTLHWQDRIGRWVAQPLPELKIEVVP